MITKEEWFGFALNRFEFEGREALVVEPKRADEEKNWAIYTEYFGAFPNTAIALLEKGFHLAYLQNQNRWGIDSDQEARHRFPARWDLEREKKMRTSLPSVWLRSA